MTTSYGKTRGGIYDAKYNYASEDDGEETPTDWTTLDSGDGDSLILGAFEGHSKVIQMNGTSTNDNAGMSHAFGASKDEGIVELWLRSEGDDGDNATIWVHLKTTGGTVVVTLKVEGQSNRATTHDSDSLADMTDGWHRFSICWNNTGGAKDVGDGGGNLADGECRYYIDGVDKGDYTLDSANDVDKIEIYSSFFVSV